MKKLTLLLLGLLFFISMYPQKEIKDLEDGKVYGPGKVISTKIIIVDGKKMKKVKYYIHRDGVTYIITREIPLKVKHIKI